MSAAFQEYATDVLEAANMATSGTVSYKVAESVWCKYNPGQTPTETDIRRTMAEIDTIAYNLRHRGQKPAKRTSESALVARPSGGRMGMTSGSVTVDLASARNRTSHSYQEFLRNTGPTPPTPPKASDRRTSRAMPRAGEVIVTKVGDAPVTPPLPPKVTRKRTNRRGARKTVTPSATGVNAALMHMTFQNRT